jgi:hypothetical protein
MERFQKKKKNPLKSINKGMIQTRGDEGREGQYAVIL